MTKSKFCTLDFVKQLPFKCLCLVAIVCGCGASKVKLPVNIELDSEFEFSEREQIKADLHALESLESATFAGSGQGHSVVSQWFEAIFSGAEASDVLRFIDERTGFYIAPKVDLTSRTLVRRDEIAQKQSVTSAIAWNYGSLLFFNGVSRNETFYFNFNGKNLRVDDSKIGLIQLNKDYFEAPTIRGSSPEAAMAWSTMVLLHEARHSDCTGGLKRSDVRKFALGSGGLEGNCTHMHSPCPAKHDYEDSSACDDSPYWGSYAVGAVFAARLAECQDCPEELIQASQVIFLDSYSRILRADKLFRGLLTKPDMSHSAHLIEDMPYED